MVIVPLCERKIGVVWAPEGKFCRCKWKFKRDVRGRIGVRCVTMFPRSACPPHRLTPQSLARGAGNKVFDDDHTLATNWAGAWVHIAWISEVQHIWGETFRKVCQHRGPRCKFRSAPYSCDQRRKRLITDRMSRISNPGMRESVKGVEITIIAQPNTASWTRLLFDRFSCRTSAGVAECEPEAKVGLQ